MNRSRRYLRPWVVWTLIIVAFWSFALLEICTAMESTHYFLMAALMFAFFMSICILIRFTKISDSFID